MSVLEFNLCVVGFLWIVFFVVAAFVHYQDKKNNVRDIGDICWPVGVDRDMAWPCVPDREKEESIRSL